MMRVLLATDGSDQATSAFRTASRLLRREGGEFDLLCVAPEFYSPRGIAGKTANKTSRMVEAYDQRIRAEERKRPKGFRDEEAQLKRLGAVLKSAKLSWRELDLNKSRQPADSVFTEATKIKNGLRR